MANFRVVASNCGCCAVKHIRDFPESPDRDYYLYSDGGHDEDQSSSQPEAYENWARDLAEKPAKAGDAFRAIVAQIKQRRPAGLITCNLVEYCEEEEDSWCCEDCDGPREDRDMSEVTFNDSIPRAWGPIMEELGFTKIVVLNSNSDNKIHHYTLAYDET